MSKLENQFCATAKFKNRSDESNSKNGWSCDAIEDAEEILEQSIHQVLGHMKALHIPTFSNFGEVLAQFLDCIEPEENIFFQPDEIEAFLPDWWTQDELNRLIELNDSSEEIDKTLRVTLGNNEKINLQTALNSIFTPVSASTDRLIRVKTHQRDQSEEISSDEETILSISNLESSDTNDSLKSLDQFNPYKIQMNHLIFFSVEKRKQKKYW